MKVGDLVRPRAASPQGAVPLVEGDWVGVVVDFIERGTVESGSTRYAVVCWNEKFPQEEEYMSQLEVLNEAG